MSDVIPLITLRIYDSPKTRFEAICMFRMLGIAKENYS